MLKRVSKVVYILYICPSCKHIHGRFKLEKGKEIIFYKSNFCVHCANDFRINNIQLKRKEYKE